MGKKNEKKLLEEKARVIGIGSSGHCVGCTHFAIMMSNYLAGFQRRNIVLLEWNGSGDFEKLETVCTGKIRKENYFRILDVDYCKAAGTLEFAGVLNCNYNDILIDFGVLEENRISEFLRCDKQFVIGSFSEWQEKAFRELVQRYGTGKESWKYLTVFGSEETRKEFKRRTGIVVERIPYSADAFSVTRECSRFFERLI